MFRFWSLSEPNNMPEDGSDRCCIHILSKCSPFFVLQPPFNLSWSIFLADTSKKMNKDLFQTNSKMACCLSKAVTPPCGEAEKRLHYNSHAQLHTISYTVMWYVLLISTKESFFYLLALTHGTSVCKVCDSRLHFYQQGFIVLRIL